MAKRVTNYKFNTRQSEYPWSQWLNGQTWALTKGKDFKCGMPSMRQMCHAAARREGKRVATQIDGDNLVIQAQSELATKKEPVSRLADSKKAGAKRKTKRKAAVASKKKKAKQPPKKKVKAKKVKAKKR